MRVGVQFPHHGIMDDVAAIRDFAQTAEGLGYSHLLIYEHIIGAQQSGRTPPIAVSAYDESIDPTSEIRRRHSFYVEAIR